MKFRFPWRAILPGVLAAAAAAAEPAADRLASLHGELTAAPHRLAGSAEGRAAGDVILRRLREAGFGEADLRVQPFEVVRLAMEPGDCRLESAAGTASLQPLRPNGLALPVTPAEGIEGETVYLGDGSWERFEGRSLRGRIAVFDYACGDRWTRAVQAGAAAILFAGDPDPAPRQPAEDPDPKCYHAHLDIPRFFVAAEEVRKHGLLEGARVRLFSRLAFARGEGRNIYAFIEGTGSGVATQEAVVLACRYDSFGPIPFAARASARAANAAGLVEAAAAIRSAPFERSVVVAFFDNDSQQQAGQLQFHFARDAAAGDPPHSLARLIRDRETERLFLEQRLAVLEEPAVVIGMQTANPVAEAAREEVLKAAERLYNRRVNDLSEAKRDYNLMDRQIERLQRRLTEARKSGPGAPEEAAGELAAKLEAELAAAKEARVKNEPAAKERVKKAESGREAIYAVRKRMTAGLPPAAEAGDAEKALYDAVIAGVRERWSRRLAELQRERAILEAHRALGERMAGRKVAAMLFWNMKPAPERWAVLGPPEDVADIVANLHLTRWLGELGGPGGGASPWPGWAGYLAGVPGAEAAGPSGRTTLVLELGHPGLAPRLPPLPLEPEADLAAFARHAEEAVALCRLIASRPELSRARLPPRLTPALVFNVPLWSEAGRYEGCFVRQYDERYKAGEDAAGAVVVMQPRGQTGLLPPADEWGVGLAFSAETGAFAYFGSRVRGLAIQAAWHDARGRITHLSLRQPSAPVGNAGNWENAGWYFEEAANQILLSEVRSRILLAGIRTPSGPVEEKAVKLIDAVTESPPKQLNLSLGGDLLAAYTGRLRRYKVLQGSQLLLDNTAANPAGEGYAVEPGFVDALARAARDTWVLNESRLDNLRRRNILENALERLHARAERLLEGAEAGGAVSALDWARRQASLGYSDRVYEPVRAVTNDMVKAVMILLLLAVPFAFAFERWVFGAANVYLQILGFACVFGAVFAILYFVHPAFRFVTFPGVVLLAFVIIIMSGVVIAIMWGKFEYEVRKLHGVAIASHQSTRTASGTIGAAVSLGIATMRRRPLRSALTAATILLLTFTILFFGSFKSEDGVRTIYVGPGPAGRLVEAGSAPGKELDPQTADMLLRLYAGSAPGYARGWAAAKEKQVLAGRLPDDTPFSVEGVAVLPADDLSLYPELRAALKGDVEGFAREGGIFLPPSVHARLKAGGGAGEVQFNGRRYVLRGTFDPARLRALRTLDGASFVPPNIREVKRQLEQEYPNDEAAVKQRLDEMELEDYPPADPETVVLVGQAGGGRLPVPVRSLVFRPASESQARAMAGELAILLNRRVSFAAGGDHFRALYAKQVQLGGLLKVLVPLVLGGLIIFGTMLSSVSDRQREIFTFSALGLGPRHVAALFFAEASVYAVVGGMGGYLFAHAFAKGVEGLARLGWVEAPMMNHSSMNAMLTLLVVMATVLASTLYPAWRASRAANPGAQRQWRMPEPEGDRLDMEFPFTVSNYDMVGLVSFLEEHLLSHREKSVGLFAADRVEAHHADGRFTLTATVWLQPFDQGVSQSFSLRTEPGAIEGVDQVHVEMRRLSGSPGIWGRSLRVFIHDLRNQFILWRTIPDEAAEHYHRLTAARFSLHGEEEG